ncbi:ZIP family metal transporter [Leifsonia sp. Root112D2]|uniref:ZIP family metal transporter n=1 Tax=Leifsonia sp. Root112D2 TaxID=1736426 RepID=UPI0006FF289E|nr:ZIP family metal transporter [Leifsonia sp. Root112D2]KQV08139.1 zinc permease [Leifsonia sp. Root112D2]
MNAVQIAVLGVIAGITIFLGLPIGRLKRPSFTLRSILNAITVGVLIFLLWDVLTHAVEPVEAALTAAALDRTRSWWPFIGLLTVFFVAVAIGLVGLVFYDRWLAHSIAARGISPRESRREGVLRLGRPTSRLAFLIAVGIGLHNFSEGLAIGQSAAAGQISLALVLVIGFGLHNATEGFGITAPLAGDGERPSWAQLAILGIIGGGPTLIGTLLGTIFVNEVVSILFLALAAGSILYVVVQLLGVAIKFARPFSLYGGLLIGLFAGFATDFIVTAAGV